MTNRRVSSKKHDEDQAAPTDNVFQLLPAMRAELLICLGQRCEIDLGQIEGQSIAIEAWYCLLRIPRGPRHGVTEMLNRNRFGTALFSRSGGSD